MVVIGYIAAVFMGLVLGIIGGGGSILTVPILVYFMAVDPGVATGYSLLIVGATAAFGAISYYKQGLIDIRSSMVFAVPSVISVYMTRAFLMPVIPDTLLTTPVAITKNVAIMLLFAMLMLASAVMMLKRAHQTTDSLSPSSTHPPKVGLIVIEGAIVGLITGLLGAGGGFLIIPALVLFMGMPMKNAVGTSLLVIAVKSLVGFIGDLQAGIPLAMPLLPLMLVATFIGMAMSTRLSGKFDSSLLPKVFAYFTLFIAIMIITQELILRG